MRVIGTVGELFITLGLVLLLFCAYELWGTGLYTQRQQQDLRETLRDRWRQQDGGRPGRAVDLSTHTFRYPEVSRGESFAVLRIPELGADYEFAIVQGAGPEQLKRGPGHFLGGGEPAMPGQTGNFVLSAHRTTYQAPFRRVDELGPDDAVVIETARWWLTYRVDGKDVVDPGAVEVAAPVPYHPARKPEQRRLTLTTCHPMYTARQRLVVFGELAQARPKSAGRPPALTDRTAGG